MVSSQPVDRASPIRVLQIVTQMNRAGLESRLMDIYRRLDREQVQFDFYTCTKNKGEFDDEILSLGGKVFYGNPLKAFRLRAIPEQFATFLKEHSEYEIVHCHLNQWCGLVLLGAERAGVPVRIAHSRTSLQKISLVNISKNIVKHIGKAAPTHRFAVSKKAGKWLYGAKFIRKGQVRVWPNAIDVEAFEFDPESRREMRRDLGLEKSQTALVHVGNFRPVKNHVFLLRVFAELQKINQETVLLLVGADHMNGKIQNLAAELNISKSVRFLGSRADIPRLLHASDIFVFPSLYEGFPGALLEAQATGLPCVFSDSITGEVKILDSAIPLSLSQGAVRWAEAVAGIRPVADEQRQRQNELVRRAGFDIAETALRYMHFYLQVSADKSFPRTVQEKK